MMTVTRSGGDAVQVRNARAEDVPALTEIYSYHVRHGAASFEVDPPSADEMMGRYARVVSVGLPYLVAHIGDCIVGYAYAAPYRSRPAYRYTVEDSVYIRSDFTGKGIGGALLPRLIAACETAGYRQMVAVIGDSANWPSIRLHEKFGFERVGLLPAVGYKFGRWIDSVLMQRPLGGGDAGSPQ